MKVVLTSQPQDVISLDKLTNRHIIVGIISDQPCYLTTPFGKEQYNFVSIGNGGTYGNGYQVGWNRDRVTLLENVEAQLKRGEQVQAFPQKEWRKALQWLLDNAPTQ